MVLAWDPNDIQGPSGFGPEGFIEGNGTFPYAIEFENQPTATAPAQTVVVTQQLDPNLDWNTFQLGSIGFGDTVVNVPSGQTSFSTQVDLTATLGIYVDIVAIFDNTTGKATWTFTSIDPATLDVPADPLAGFLLPDTTNGNGQGFVNYTVMPLKTVKTTDKISGQATVVFDNNPPLNTASILNTIDAGLPTSSVAPLPGQSQATFNVSWSGHDDSGGSGIAAYDIFVAVNGGSWTLWQNQTALTSAAYAGQPGHSYAFYSVAFDNAGNQESKTPVVEAQTTTPVLQTTLTESAHPSTATTVKIATMLGAHFSDPDKNKKPGIAITATTGTGTWQFNNGIGWVNIAAVSDTSALLLPAADSLRFVPSGLWSGAADLLYVAWDGSQGTAGHYANATNLGSGTPFSSSAGMLAVNVTPIVHAPLWGASTVTLAPVPVGAMSPNGETVQQAFGAVFSGDTGQTAGVAVTGPAATSNGTWEYNLYNPTTQQYVGWQKLPIVSTSGAWLLSAQDMIAFVPKTTVFTGVVTLQVRAWDGSSGTHGTAVNLTKVGTGGKTAFSSAFLTGQLHVNTAPTQNPPPGGINLLPSIHENVTSTAVSVATLLKDAHAADADKGTTLGLALTGASGPGIWQYQLGTGWQAVPATISAASSLLLPPGATLRFVPTPNQAGTATLTCVAWDRTQGASGVKGFDSTTAGGASAFSSISATATLTIIPAVGHQAPAWNGSGAVLAPVAPSALNPPGDTVAAIFGTFFADPGTIVGIAVTGLTGTTNGMWQYFDGTNWNGFKTPSVGKAVLLTAGAKIRFVPKSGFVGTATLTAYAWDGTSSNTNLIGHLGGSGAFSAKPLTATCLVNTSPTLAP